MLSELDGIQEISRTEVLGLRVMMRQLGVTVAEVDRELRYVWIDNPHPDFNPNTVVGKRDDELISPHAASDIIRLKRIVVKQKRPVEATLQFDRSAGSNKYSFSAFPITDPRGALVGIFTVGFPI